MTVTHTSLTSYRHHAIPAISTGPFTATPVGLVVSSDCVPYELWQEYGARLKRVEGAIQWVIGDWLNYGERAYGETYSQALSLWPEAEYQTLALYSSVAERCEFPIRIRNLSWSHHREVAKLPPEEQSRWLREAEASGLTVRELRHAIRDANKQEPPPLPSGLYSVIYADPPWQFDNSGFDQSAEAHYPTLSTEEICELEVPAGDMAVLFLWATNAMLEDALLVMEAWGFDYKTNMVWVKDRGPGIGWFTRGRHELLLIGTRGDGMHPNIKLPSVIQSSVSQHSRKPEEAYGAIEEMYDGPYLEMFARRQREGWSVWGNEIARQT